MLTGLSLAELVIVCDGLRAGRRLAELVIDLRTGPPLPDPDPVTHGELRRQKERASALIGESQVTSGL